MSGMTRSTRAFSTKALKVFNNVAKQQFEISLIEKDNISLRSSTAVLKYTQTGKDIDFNHTKVPTSFQGKGIGKILAQHALVHAQENGLSVNCKCHFIAQHYQNNLEQFKQLKIKFALEE